MQLNTLSLIAISWAGWADTHTRLLLVALITAGFAVLGHAVRGVTRRGAAAGAIVCFVLFAAAGPGGFAALLSVFAVTWVATRIGLASKLRMGTAERREGRRASQVLANLGVAALCAILYGMLRDVRMLVAMSAALCEAAADTVSSECGQAFSKQARLITTFEIVPAGSDGGITVGGTLAGVGAAVLISAVTVVSGMVPRWSLWITAGAGIFGMLADSYLGAWLERRGGLSNDGVNLISTAIAAMLALLLIALLA